MIDNFQYTDGECPDFSPFQNNKKKFLISFFLKMDNELQIQLSPYLNFKISMSVIHTSSRPVGMARRFCSFSTDTFPSFLLTTFSPFLYFISDMAHLLTRNCLSLYQCTHRLKCRLAEIKVKQQPMHITSINVEIKNSQLSLSQVDQWHQYPISWTLRNSNCLQHQCQTLIFYMTDFVKFC